METENPNSNNEENVDIDTTENIDPVVDDTTAPEGETPEEQIIRLEEANKQLFARAKKAEGKAKTTPESPTINKVVPQPEAPSDITNLVGLEVQKVMDQQNLDALEVSDEFKESMKAYAKAEGITIKKAMESDYFEFKKEKEDNAKKVENASLSSKHGAPSKIQFDVKSPPKVDLQTPEGQELWEAWKKYLKDNS